MPPSKSQTKSLPASVVRGYPPGGLKRNYHDSDPNMSGIFHIFKSIFYKGITKTAVLPHKKTKTKNNCFDLFVSFFNLITEAYLKHIF